MTACAAFSKESRMRFANATKLDRKSGGAKPRDLRFSQVAAGAGCKMGGIMKILTGEKRGCRKGPEAWFTGTVWLNEIVNPSAPSRLKANHVWFGPGSRTAWHTHPVGQTLHVLDGLGLVQLAGEPPQIIRPGDTILIAPQERHWHGAAPGRTMAHIAMQEADEHGIDVVWLEHVTDEEYATT
jgi:quercetin dioxygenase-like cupin family protein